MMDADHGMVPPAPPGALVEVVPLGAVNQTAAAVVAANLQAILGLDADLAPPAPEPEHALVPARGQYDASLILQELAQRPTPPPLCLGLTRHDLCLPFLSHVFGEAQLEGRAAVVSLHRLGQGEGSQPVPRALLLERAAKVALHESAHLLGLTHCRAPRCLMNFSAGLDKLDRLELSLCPTCRGQAARKRLALIG
ncbi:MAG: archaemetzincin [Desulfarculaceae bacterium]|nr:archaemetzincin [Desulfarculaceae bacterium]